jgi:hypothetical protein
MASNDTVHDSKDTSDNDDGCLCDTGRDLGCFEHFELEAGQ